MMRRAFLAGWLFWVLAFPAAVRSEFMAGAAEVDITPQHWPQSLRGSFSPRKAESANDPLHARAFAMQNGNGRAVIVIVDNLMMSREILDEIKAQAAIESGWLPGEMLIAGTHTHSAPSISGGDGSEPAMAYRDQATSSIVKVMSEAIANLKAAKVGFGADEETSEVNNRRWYLEEGTMPLNPFGEMDEVKMNPSKKDIMKPAGPTDPTVAVIDFRDEKDKPLALLANYPLHYVGAVPGGQVSADYFGEFARVFPSRMGRNTPGSFVVAMSNGTSGDINNIDFAGSRAPRAPGEQIRQVATKVADAAWRALDGIEYQDDPVVAMQQRMISLNVRKPDEAAVERAREIAAMSAEEQEKAELPRLATHYAARTLSALERDDEVEVIIQAIQIGDQAVLAMPFEVLVEIGLDLKERSPFEHTMIIELANGAEGYLPPPHQHELGGYETWLGTSKVQKDASVILSDALIEMLKELKER